MQDIGTGNIEDIGAGRPIRVRFDPHEEANLHERILVGVSRTFALTIPQLPEGLREAVTNAYLLCRIADTIEDDPLLDTETKDAFHSAFLEAAESGRGAEDFAQDRVAAARARYPRSRDRADPGMPAGSRNDPPTLAAPAQRHPAVSHNHEPWHGSIRAQPEPSRALGRGRTRALLLLRCRCGRRDVDGALLRPLAPDRTPSATTSRPGR